MNICIAGNRGHLGYVFDALPTLASVRIAGIHAADRAELAELQGRCRAVGADPATGDDWPALLDARKPDVAVVCGPFEDHAAMCIAAFERDMHVFCEKPVALTLDELAALSAAFAAASARSGIHFGGMMGLRYDPAFHAAHAIVASGGIGDVRLVNAQKSYKLGNRPAYYRERATYGGTIPWVGSHAIDWVSWFTGKAFVSVDARHSTAANRGNGTLETLGLCRFELEDGILASVTVDYLRPEAATTHGDDRIRVVGTRGVVEVRGGKAYLTDAAHPASEVITVRPIPSIFADFVACAQGASSIAELDGATTLDVTEACLLARLSADERRGIEFPER